VSQTSKNACPGCGVKFRTGGLLPENERQRLQRVGIVNLGEPPELIECPKCGAKLKVTEVQMGTFFTRQ
jgi:DNA-directed RNA polymerase subunit RPC12/RpoP